MQNRESGSVRNVQLVPVSCCCRSAYSESPPMHPQEVWTYLWVVWGQLRLRSLLNKPLPLLSKSTVAMKAPPQINCRAKPLHLPSGAGSSSFLCSQLLVFHFGLGLPLLLSQVLFSAHTWGGESSHMWTLAQLWKRQGVADTAGVCRECLLWHWALRGRLPSLGWVGCSFTGGVGPRWRHPWQGQAPLRHKENVVVTAWGAHSLM